MSVAATQPPARSSSEPISPVVPLQPSPSTLWSAWRDSSCGVDVVRRGRPATSVRAATSCTAEAKVTVHPRVGRRRHDDATADDDQVADVPDRGRRVGDRDGPVGHGAEGSGLGVEGRSEESPGRGGGAPVPPHGDRGRAHAHQREALVLLPARRERKGPDDRERGVVDVDDVPGTVAGDHGVPVRGSRHRGDRLQVRGVGPRPAEVDHASPRPAGSRSGSGPRSCCRAPAPSQLIRGLPARSRRRSCPFRHGSSRARGRRPARASTPRGRRRARRR